MTWSLSFEPLFSWPVLAALLVPLALLMAVSLFLGRRGALLRLAALAVLALALFNPVLLDEQREPLKSVVAVVVDESQSQDIGERAAETVRPLTWRATAERTQEVYRRAGAPPEPSPAVSGEVRA